MRRARLRITPPYDLIRTLQSGQCFRWAADGRWARGVVHGTVARVAQAARGLEVRWDGPPGTLADLRRHLGADQPLGEIEAALARDQVLRRLLPETSGIALMRQDPWECLASYVVSAFNNIPKISLSVARLSEAFGRPIGRGQPAGAFSFPTAARLAEAPLPRLRECALGYRAPYVRALARLVADGDVDLARIGRLSLDDARVTLLALPGVGEKVAECVLLFAFGRAEAFPVDVWVQRAVEQWYFRGRTRSTREVRAWAGERFGPFAGYAQQHLFVAARAQTPLRAARARSGRQPSSTPPGSPECGLRARSGNRR